MTARLEYAAGPDRVRTDMDTAFGEKRTLLDRHGYLAQVSVSGGGVSGRRLSRFARGVSGRASLALLAPPPLSSC